MRALSTARSASVPFLVENLRLSREDVLPRIQARLDRPEITAKERVRLQLALLTLNEHRPAHEVLYQLRQDMTESSAAEFLTVRRLLLPYAKQFTNDLWMLALHRADTSPDSRFRAQCALALYAPDSGHWEGISQDAVERLLAENTWDLPHWGEALRPVREFLLPHLKAAYGGSQSELRLSAAIVLAELFEDRVELLVELALQAEPRQSSRILPKLRPHREPADALLRAALKTDSQSSHTEESNQQIANAAIALLYLGDSAAVWPLMKQQTDQRLRTRLIHSLGLAEIDPRVIRQRMFAESDPLILSALITSLGEFPVHVLPARERAAIGSRLLQLYRTHPHSGVHSAFDWLLTKWGFEAELRDVDESMITAKVPDDRSWFLTRRGHTMAVLRGPVTFPMGSAEDEIDRSHRDEKQHQRRIPHSFAISTKEVTLEQFLKFRESADAEKHGPDPRCPVINVNWYDALAYCRWLSEQEGIPEQEMCLPPVADIHPDKPRFDVHIARTGYRLPTAAEWEYACRGGAQTSRHFGDGERMLKFYAWYNANSENRTWPVGRLKPNTFGLFDVYGNATEWCQDLFFRDYPTPVAGLVIDQTDPRDGFEYELRGGDFQQPPAVARSAWRDYQLPRHRSYLFGFRVARTLVAD